jgi:BirA family transcriptional regulator, biotin operon repressor / biotin---[acetyl-CoA-carboxylase] ligase
MSPPRLISLVTTDSTSTHARRLLELGDPAPPFVVAARTQTAGRGQFTRSWSSPVGGLWCTYAFPQAGISLEALGLRIGLACARTVEGALRSAGNGNDVRLKWPNDVYVVGKKILGVLTESISVRASQFLLIGVGINANFDASHLPPEIAARATSLRDRTGRSFDLEVLRNDLTSNLERALAAPGLDRSILAEARFRLHGVGQEAEIRDPDGNTVRGTLVGLDDSGNPIVRSGDEGSNT